MATVYIAAHIIPANDRDEPTPAGVFEFEAATWIDALDMAYEWLRKYRKETCAYHVYC